MTLLDPALADLGDDLSAAISPSVVRRPSQRDDEYIQLRSLPQDMVKVRLSFLESLGATSHGWHARPILAEIEGGRKRRRHSGARLNPGCPLQESSFGP